MTHDVFISYSTKDKLIADDVVATLEGRGVRCWMAPRDILAGTDWSASIIRAINHSKVFVLIYSANANDSPQIQREVERAANKRLAILPFRIEDVPMSESLEYFISTRQWLDALTSPMQKHLDSLWRAVEALLQKGTSSATAHSVLKPSQPILSAPKAPSQPTQIPAQGRALPQPRKPLSQRQPAQIPKEGRSLLAWVLIGSGLIIVSGLVFGSLVATGGWFAKEKMAAFQENPNLAAAKLAVRLNPDLELVSTDEKNSTITIKNTKTGEVMTMSAEDAKEGRWTFKSDEGTATFDASGKEGTLKVTTGKGEVATFGAGAPQNLPSWLPVYLGGTVQGTFDTTNAEGRSASFTVNTKDPVTKVLDYYEAELKAAGFKTDKTTFPTNDQTAGGSVTATTEDRKRQVNIMVSTSDEGTGAIVSFQEKK